MAVFNRSDAGRKRITGSIFSFSGGKLTKIIYAFDREFQLLSNGTLISSVTVSGDLL